MESVSSLVEALRTYQLLEPAQLDEVAGALEKGFTDPRTLAKELLRRGWLTAYQINSLFQGRGKELLLGTYVLLERLGEGGMGLVFKARHVKLGRVVALKVIRKEKLANPQAIRRFKREIQMASKLSHPNVVLAFDADQVGSTHFYAMEYVDGSDLAERLEEPTPLPVAEARDYLRQAARGLQHAHERGLVHRDIKPANLLVTGGGRLKILDMGLARLNNPALDDLETSHLTQEGSVMGTVDYLAPEQALDSHTVDIRADLYGLGCTIYHLLTGQVPFPGGTALQRLLRHREELAQPVEELRPDVPPHLAGIIRKLMAKRPEDRYQSPAELLAALESDANAPSQEGTSQRVSPDEPVASSNAPIGSSTTELASTWAAVVADSRSSSVLIERRSTAQRRLVLMATTCGAMLFCFAGLLVAVIAKQAQKPADTRPSDVAAGSGTSPMSALKVLLDKADDPRNNREELRLALLDFRVKFPGTPQARTAGEHLVHFESPLDRLDPSQSKINDRFLQPDARKFLVGMLGRPRNPRDSIPLWTVAFSPDGKTIATGGQEGKIRLWEGNTGEERRQPLGEHQGPITAVAFAPSGQTLASASHDNTIKLWNMSTGKMTFNLKGHNHIVSAIAFAPTASDWLPRATTARSGSGAWQPATRLPHSVSTPSRS
jgi:serine/threonine protein kinase